MPKTPPPEGTPEELPEQIDDDSVLADSFYEVPAELKDTTEPVQPAEGPPPADEDDVEEAPRARRPFPAGKVALVVVALVAVGAALMIFRAQERRRAVREGITKAEQLLLLDTADGYRKAGDLLAPLAQLDPLEAGSARAFALAMLAADYRDPKAESEANALLVVPGRADALPRYAALAFAALALGKNGLGDATSALGSAGGSPWTDALQARVALRAGTLEAAVGPAASAAAVSGFAPGLAVHGDVARRAHHDGRTARTAYEAALAASPSEPRAIFGLAKLALSGDAPEPEAREALSRLVTGGEGIPAPERGRAALHLAALRLRTGEALSAVRRDAAAVAGDKQLDWLMGAARAEASSRGAYRAVAGAPPSLESASDDDPPEVKALPPEPPPPPPPEPPRAPVVQKAKFVAHVTKGARFTVKPAASKKAPVKSTAKTTAKVTAKSSAKVAQTKAAAKAAAKRKAASKKFAD